MKQDSMEKRFKRMIKAVRIGKCLVIVNHSTEILAFIKQELKEAIGKDEAMKYPSLQSITKVRNQLRKEQRRKVGLG